MGEPSADVNVCASAQIFGSLTWNFACDRLESTLELLPVIDLPYSLSSSTFARFYHDRISNLLSFLETLFPIVNTSLVICLVWDSDKALRGECGVGDACTRPGHAGNMGVLGDDGR